MIGLTGHTAGLGAALYERLPQARVFSRSNGYNINSLDDRCRIVDELADCNVFINNAHNGFGQISLLQQVFTAWQDQPKLILNIGSRASEYSYGVNWTYSAEKAALMDLTKSLTLLGKPCRITTLCFGYIGTERILQKYPDLTDYIELPHAVDFILQIKQLLEKSPAYTLPYLLYHA